MYVYHAGGFCSTRSKTAHAGILAGIETIPEIAIKIGCSEVTLLKGFERLSLKHFPTKNQKAKKSKNEQNQQTRCAQDLPKVQKLQGFFSR